MYANLSQWCRSDECQAPVQVTFIFETGLESNSVYPPVKAIEYLLGGQNFSIAQITIIAFGAVGVQLLKPMNAGDSIGFDAAIPVNDE